MANTPVNKELYARVKAEAKRKFDTWPSAYASAWLVKTYKKRGGKYRKSSKQFGGMSDAALNSMQSFYKDMQKNRYNPSLMQNSLDEISRLQEMNPRETYLKNIKSGTGETLYKNLDVPLEYVNAQVGWDKEGNRLYKNILKLDQDGFAPTNNLGYSNEVPEGTQYIPDAYGNDYSVKPPEMKEGGIPERYKKMGFTKVGVKKKSNRSGKKWMVLAKKGDKYKVVHGGYTGMKDYSQHGSAERKKNFWNRMGGKNSAKANDPFSPLYWHKKFGTWQEGGQFIYDPNNPMPQFEMGNSILDKMKKETMRKGGQPCYECGGMYKNGGTNNPGFRALPPHVQQKIKANMNNGGMTPFNADSNYYGERLEKFIGNVRNTAAENLFPDMEEEVMQMPQARYGMPIYQNAGSVNSELTFMQVLEAAYGTEKAKEIYNNLAPGHIEVFENEIIPSYNGDIGLAQFETRRAINETTPFGDVNPNNKTQDSYDLLVEQYYPETIPFEASSEFEIQNEDGTYSYISPEQWQNEQFGNDDFAQFIEGNAPRLDPVEGTPIMLQRPEEPLVEEEQTEEEQTEEQTSSSSQTPQPPAPPAAPAPPTVAQRFTEATGLPWQEAHNRGLTDGLRDSNLELIRRIENGESIDDIQRSSIPTDIRDNSITEEQSYTSNTSSGVNYDDGQAMYTDPNTGMVMNVPQEYFGQQAMPAAPQSGMYPQYGYPYLQRAQYKYGPLGRNLRRVDLEWGIPGQQGMIPQGMTPADFTANAGNVTPEAIIQGMQNSGMMNPKDARRAQKKAIKEMRKASRNKLSGMRQASREASREENQINKANRFENRMQRKSDRINDRFDRKAERIQNNAKNGGMTNPYLYMYKQGGEYYMDEDTINMIMAMGGDIEFLD